MQKGRAVLSYLSSRILCIILSTIIVLVHYYTCRNILLQWIESHLGGLAKNIGITDRLIWNSTMSKYVYGICYVFILHWLHMHPMSNHFMITHSEFHHKGRRSEISVFDLNFCNLNPKCLLSYHLCCPLIPKNIFIHSQKIFIVLTFHILICQRCEMSLFFRLIVYFEIGKVSRFL